MDALDAIQKRSGCRKYKDTPVEKEKIGMILDAGRMAPSAGNLQDRSFIVIHDEEKRKQISFACGNQTWMQSAPVHIVVVSENKKNKKFYGEKGEKIYTIQDTAFAVENMLIAATALEVGSSLVIGFDNNTMKDIIQTPDGVLIHAVVTLGYPSEETKPSSKYELDKFVYFEEYGKRIENEALLLGEYSTLREQATDKAIDATKRSSKSIIEKIKSLFKKKEEVGQDHFMEEKPVRHEEVVEQVEVPKEKPKRLVTSDFRTPEEIIKAHQEKMRSKPISEERQMVGKDEIPRELPKQHKKAN